MNERRADDSPIEQIADLPNQAVDAREAERVKGGFNPQPDPPKVWLPVFQLPVFNPGGFARP